MADFGIRQQIPRGGNFQTSTPGRQNTYGELTINNAAQVGQVLQTRLGPAKVTKVIAFGDRVKARLEYYGSEIIVARTGLRPNADPVVFDINAAKGVGNSPSGESRSEDPMSFEVLPGLVPGP